MKAHASSAPESFSSPQAHSKKNISFQKNIAPLQDQPLLQRCKPTRLMRSTTENFAAKVLIARSWLHQWDAQASQTVLHCPI